MKKGGPYFDNRSSQWITGLLSVVNFVQLGYGKEWTKG